MKSPVLPFCSKRPRTLCLSAAGVLGVSGLLLLSACASTGFRTVKGYALPPDAPQDMEFRLISWNVHKGKDPDMPVDLQRTLQKYTPEVLFLQEARPGHQTSPHVEGTLAPAWKQPFDDASHVGVFTASTLTPLEETSFISPARELGFTTPKAALLTRLKLPDGRELLAVNVHALNFEHGEPHRFARQMKVLHQRMLAHKGPILFAGDFNTWNAGRDRHLRTLAGEIGLKEVSGFGDKRKTGCQGWINSLVGIDPELPLDRVFYRGLEVTSAEVLPLDSSDHAPLLVRFRAPSPL